MFLIGVHMHLMQLMHLMGCPLRASQSNILFFFLDFGDSVLLYIFIYIYTYICVCKCIDITCHNYKLHLLRADSAPYIMTSPLQNHLAAPEVLSGQKHKNHPLVNGKLYKKLLKIGFYSDSMGY